MTALPLVLPVIVLGLGLNALPVLKDWGRIGDLSYGVYLWAFPLQQLLIRAQGPAIAPALLALQCLAVVSPIAALSWWLVERPALSVKGALRARLVRFDDEPIPIAPAGGGRSETLTPFG